MFVLAPSFGSAAHLKAAEVFCALYEQVTGNPIAMKNTPSDTEDMIVIGMDDVQPYAFAQLEGGFPLRSGTDDYCIISKKEESRTLLFLAGGRGRSTLYAVYDFFERQAGCHYFWDGDVIPHRDTISIEDLYVVEKPRFSYRAIRYFAHRGLTRFQAEHWDFEEWKQEIDWAVKSRLNMFMLRIGMDDVFQKAFPDIVPYPPTDEKQPGAGAGYNNRTTAWPLEYRGELRKKVLAYAFDCDLMHPEDFGTMTHWYSRTPVEYLEKVQPKLMSQQSTTYSEQTGQVWDIFEDENVDNYLKLTDTHIKEYGKAEIFHTIGLAERKFSDDPKKNIELKKFAYRRFLSRIQEKYPNAKTLIAAWDFYFRLSPEDVKELVKVFDPENTMILDYTVDLKFEKSNMDNWDIIGKFPWIFGLFHGYMPQNYAHGEYEFIAEKFAQADADPMCKGADLWPEMSHSDTLMLTYFTENAWKPTGRPIEEVAKELCQKRYPEYAEDMWQVWKAALPLLRLPDFNYYHCWYNLLKNDVLNNLMDITAEGHENALHIWQPRVERQKGAEGNYTQAIDDLLQQIRQLPDRVLENKFALRDCVDLVNSVLGERLHINYIDAAIAFAHWQKGQQTAEAVRTKWENCRKLLASLVGVLDSHPDYSMYATFVHQGKNRKVNPFFEDALKDNILNDYCRTAAYELVKYVYCAEAEVLEEQIADCLAKGAGSAPCKQTVAEERAKIFDAFKAMPLKEMQSDVQCGIKAAVSSVLEITK